MARTAFCKYFGGPLKDAAGESLLREKRKWGMLAVLGVYRCELFGETNLARCSYCLVREKGTSNSEDAKSVDKPAEKGGAGNAGV